MVIEALVKTVLSEMRQLAKTETVIGEAVAIGDVTIIPVSKLSIGFGVGGGQRGSKNSEGEATGGGATVEPVAFFVIRGDSVELVSINKNNTQWSKLINMVPDLVSKVNQYTHKEGDSAEEEGNLS